MPHISSLAFIVARAPRRAIAPIPQSGSGNSLTAPVFRAAHRPPTEAEIQCELARLKSRG
jgi:hypothetical protein